MGYVGYTLIVASVVWVIVAPPPWIHPYLPPFLAAAHAQKPSTTESSERKPAKAPSEVARDNCSPAEQAKQDEAPTIQIEDAATTSSKATSDRAAMPPPPMIQRPGSFPVPAPPTISAPSGGKDEDEQTTPKAEPQLNVPPVPSFSLSPDDASTLSTTAPAVTSPTPSINPTPTASSSSMMPPPPAPRAAPPRLNPVSPFLPDSPQVARGPSRPSSGSPFLSDSPQVARGPSRLNPAPNRSLGASLAPPPTHSQAPQKPSRKVLLTPGHSPLDWARISGPTADLRNLPPSTPYLKVTPSMLKRQTGRKGTDAWTALGGRVYNISPYVPYHPGGGPELLRCAGKDGSKLFGEVHPWVNYETMLSACLVGILVPEDQEKTSEMDQMD